jgi:hypothetical protein
MGVAFCLLFKVFITHTAETFHYPRTWVMMWSTRFTLMPRCSMICQSVAQRSHCTIWSALALVSGFITWGEQPGHARSSVLLIPSLNLLHQLDTAICCKQLLPYTRFIQEWKSAGLAPSAHRNWKIQCCVCQDESMNLLHWAARCCADITQSSLLMKCAYWGW